MTLTELKKMALRIALDGTTEADEDYIKNHATYPELIVLHDLVQEFCPNYWNNGKGAK